MGITLNPIIDFTPEFSMEIKVVDNRRDLREFINFPYKLYKDDPVWVPPLRSEQKAQFNPQRNPMLDHCKTRLFLLLDGGVVIGRCSAFIDHLAVNYWGESIGLFGSFECVENEDVAFLLLDSAWQWLASRGMKTMRGPWSFASQEWGLEIEGGSRPPVIFALHNPAYYADYFEAFGLEKAIDLLAYLADMGEGYQFPERYLTLTEKIQARYGVTVRSVDMSDLEADVMKIVDLSNRSISDNWGYTPVTQDEARAMARDLRQIVNPEVILIAEDPNGEPIGFALSLPDINTLLKDMDGRVLPFGWIKLLTGLNHIRQYRMWGLGWYLSTRGKPLTPCCIKQPMRHSKTLMYVWK